MGYPYHMDSIEDIENSYFITAYDRNPVVIITKDLYHKLPSSKLRLKKIEIIHENEDGTLTVRLWREYPYEEKTYSDLEH